MSQIKAYHFNFFNWEKKFNFSDTFEIFILFFVFLTPRCLEKICLMPTYVFDYNKWGFKVSLYYAISISAKNNYESFLMKKTKRWKYWEKKKKPQVGGTYAHFFKF